MNDTEVRRKAKAEAIMTLLQELPGAVQTSVLVLDDEDDDELLLRTRLEKLGVELTWAKSPFEATKLIEDRKFEYVIVDHGLGAGQETGSDWLHKNLKNLAGARVRIRTGLREHLNHVEEFKLAGVGIAEKATESEDVVVWDPVEDFAEKKITAATARVLKFIPRGREPIGGEPDLELAKEVTLMFERWLKSFPSLTEPVLEMDGDLYSPGRLIDEARKGSGLGLRLKHLFVKQMWRRLGLKDELLAAGE